MQWLQLRRDATATVQLSYDYTSRRMH